MDHYYAEDLEFHYTFGGVTHTDLWAFNLGFFKVTKSAHNRLSLTSLVSSYFVDNRHQS